MTKTFDLLIRGGTIVDGNGGEPYVGDVAIRDGQIVAVGDVSGEAGEIIDAKGLVVTPGFVDIHSHYDGQAFFDDTLSPSNAHGVTTVVLGVCGIGFAPARAADHDLLVTTMESVEDIPVLWSSAELPKDSECYREVLTKCQRCTGHVLAKYSRVASASCQRV